MKLSTILGICLGVTASAVANPARGTDGLAIFEARGINVVRQGCVSFLELERRCNEQEARI